MVGILDKLKAAQAEQAKARLEADARRAAERQAEAERRAQDEAANRERLAREILGDELFEMDVSTAADARQAIKLAKLRKRDYQADKKAISAAATDEREAWRARQAGRIPNITRRSGFMASAVRASRSVERQGHAARANSFSDRKQAVDARIGVIDRFILELERQIPSLPAGAPPLSARSARGASSGANPLAALEQLAAMRDRGLITAAEFDAKKAELLGRM